MRSSQAVVERVASEKAVEEREEAARRVAAGEVVSEDEEDEVDEEEGEKNILERLGIGLDDIPILREIFVLLDSRFDTMLAQPHMLLDTYDMCVSYLPSALAS